MGRLSEYFDYINKEKEVGAEYDAVNYTHMTVTDELKGLRKNLLRERRVRDNKDRG